MAERKKGPPRSRVQSGPLAQRTGKQRTPARPRGGDSGAVSVEKRPLSKLAYKEVKGDLFDCPPDCSLAHCVSEDMAMGKGIATLFKEKFGGVSQLKAQGVKTGGLALLEREGRFVYYLVTKRRSVHKPTYATLQSSLSLMKDHCQKNSVKELALPRIGCGLDKLSWDRVSEIIQSTFRELEMAVTVYYL